MRKTKEANYFHCYIQYTSLTCEFILTLCSFNNIVFISLYAVSIVSDASAASNGGK